MAYTEEIYITPSDMLEYLVCPRFTYFMSCLCIPQHQEQRYKVMRGREVHHQVLSRNKDYLRKRLGCIGKEMDVPLASEKYHLRGIVDEVLHLSDGTISPLDFKFAFFKGLVHTTLRIQSVLYALMIRDNYGKNVKKGFICFVRSNHHLEEIVYTRNDFDRAVRCVNDIFRILALGFCPKRRARPSKCSDCCYRNICV